MSDLILPPNVVDLNGHRSASQRREAALQVDLAMTKNLVAHLQAVLVIALEQRGGVPLIILAARREEILSKRGKVYNVEQSESGDVTYTLPAPEPEAADDKGGYIKGLTTPPVEPS